MANPCLALGRVAVSVGMKAASGWSPMQKVKYGYKWWRWYECGRKRPYRKKDAESKVAERNEPGLNVYRCHFCPSWHIGHLSQMWGGGDQGSDDGSQNTAGPATEGTGDNPNQGGTQ